jgi:hypothetical protein
MTAGAAVKSGHVVWLDPSNNQAKHFDPNSESIDPTALAMTQGTGAGSLVHSPPQGVVRHGDYQRSADRQTPRYVSALTPGVMVGSYAAASRMGR